MFLKVANACFERKITQFLLDILLRELSTWFTTAVCGICFEWFIWDASALTLWDGEEALRTRQGRNSGRLGSCFLPQKESHIISILFVICVWNQEPFNFRTCPWKIVLVITGASLSIHCTCWVPFGNCRFLSWIHLGDATSELVIEVWMSLPLEIGDICFQASISTPNTQFGVHSAVLLSLLFANSRCHFMPGSNDYTPRTWWHWNPRLCLRRGAYTQCKWYD